MACLSEKINIGVALTAMVGSGLATGATAETVIVAVGAFTAFLSACAGYIKACYDLGTCLAAAGRPDDAAKVNAHAQQMERDIAALKKKCGL